MARTRTESPEDERLVSDQFSGLAESPGAERQTVRDLGNDGREDRALDERTHDDRDHEEGLRLEEFMAGFHQEALPQLPKIPGFHTFWATTTNTRDTVATRLRMGYQFVEVADVGPDYESLVNKASEYQGRIMVNEMIAMKLPLSLYQRYMHHVHHKLPEDEQRKLTVAVDTINEQANRLGSRVIEEEAQAALRHHRPAPNFVGRGVD